MGALRRIGVAAHRVAFSSRVAAGAYVASWGALRRFPLPQAAALRIANAAGVAAVGREGVFGPAKPRKVTTPAGAVRLLLRPQDFGFRPLVSQSLGYEDEVFRLLADRVDQYDAVIEIGANIGVFTTALGALFRRSGKDISRVVAFEPGKSAYARLRQNLELNGLGEVTAVEAAVSDSDGTATFFEAAPMATTSSLHRVYAAAGGRAVGETIVRTVDAARLGDYVPGARRVLVKIDAEGHETAIMARLAPFVHERRPDIIVEVLRGGGQAISDQMRRWDYQCHRAFAPRGSRMSHYRLLTIIRVIGC